MDPGRKPERNTDRDQSAEDERLRGRQNIAAGVIVVVLVIACWWLVTAWNRSQLIERCLEAGRTNCIPLDTSPPPAQQ